MFPEHGLSLCVGPHTDLSTHSRNTLRPYQLEGLALGMDEIDTYSNGEYDDMPVEPHEPVSIGHQEAVHEDAPGSLEEPDGMAFDSALLQPPAEFQHMSLMAAAETQDGIFNAPPLEEPGGMAGGNARLQPQADFQHMALTMDRAPTIEDASTDLATPLRQISIAYQEDLSSPVDKLSQSIGQASSVGEDIDVSTEALIEETLERLSFVHGVQAAAAWFLVS